MGFLKPDAPKQPDPAATAKSVAGLNKDAAQDTLRLNQVDRSGVFGSSNFTKDENGLPTGITNSLAPGLQPAAGNLTGAFGAQTGNLPTNINYDSTTPGNILNAGMQTYDALAQDPIRQGQGRISQEIANRGLPINDSISQDLQGNFDRQNGLARQSAFSTLYGQLPGMQSTLTDTANKQAMAPGALAGQTAQNMGLLNGLIPQASQPQASIGSAGGTFAQQTQDNYDQALKQYQADQAGLGGLLKTGATLAANYFMPGSGAALGGLFNNSGGAGNAGIGSR